MMWFWCLLRFRCLDWREHGDAFAVRRDIIVYPGEAVVRDRDLFFRSTRGVSRTPGGAARSRSLSRSRYCARLTQMVYPVKERKTQKLIPGNFICEGEAHEVEQA
jgi:hypothetical protein